ncbi:uncharacterized protein KQ657_002587 [Scheffersomyces spartinae]|uniref:RRM Nup35-type domain-containing protein n=1 Tax=Scheffersomyces spartinae TaxID=45513 RepID=A0A9P8AGP7_9ASCO|nr:uncharacterized protein KQ657_002587 [Scheffersomyces spartinae]KAG7191980.1 hypothetical protein KQ657_002587 [Scheffersomyces spartinae]
MTSLYGPGSSDGSQTSIGSKKNDNPAWFKKTTKRTIPNHLVPKRKTGFQLAPSSNENASKSTVGPGNSGDTNPMSWLLFNSQHRNSIVDDNKSTLEDSSSLMVDESPFLGSGPDLPPKRSLYDLDDEVLLALNKPAQHVDSFINKDPKNFTNVFNKSAAHVTSGDSENGKDKNELLDGDLAVLVFGYPDFMVTQVIQRFEEFGNVLEPFDTKYTLNKLVLTLNILLLVELGHKYKNVPILAGEGWIKITYDNPISAIDALQMNGKVFNGSLLGVAPYSKESIEQLQSRKLTIDEDIGGKGGEYSSLFSNTNAIAKEPPKRFNLDEEKSGASVTASASSSTRLDIKDGSSLFLQSQEDKAKEEEKKKNEKLGMVGTIFRALFGFHEL